MAKATICPVCQGSGKFLLPLVPNSTSSVRQKVKCHGCNGRGWVEVSEDLIYPYSPYYPYWLYPNYPFPPLITYTRDYFTGID